MLLTPNFMKIHTSAASGLISLPALVVEAASLIGKETDERRMLQRRTISIERLTSNVDSMYSVCLKKRFREAIPHFEVLGRSRRAGAPAAPAPRVVPSFYKRGDGTGNFRHPGQSLPENLLGPLHNMRSNGNCRGGCRGRCIAHMKGSFGVYK